MSNSNMDSVVKSSSFLRNLKDNLNSESLHFGDYVLNVPENVSNRLQTMTGPSIKMSDKIVLIPESLMMILKNKETLLAENKNYVWYYCDICYMSTSLYESWAKHMRENHFASFPECLLSCNTCGLFIYGLEEKLIAYINSPSHRAVDKMICKKRVKERLHFPSIYSSGDWEKIKSYGVVRCKDNNLSVNKSIKVASKTFNFTSSSQHPFEELFYWMDSCFPKSKPIVQCDICVIPRVTFSTASLWYHLTSAEHMGKTNKCSGELGFLVCSTCEKIFISSLSVLSNHSHTGVICATFDKAFENQQLVELFSRIFNYILRRYSKEAFCHCCPTMYYCHVCCFLCSYFPYWEHHLSNENHILKANKISTLITEKCPDCGLVALIDKGFLFLLKLPFHAHVDLVLRSRKIDNNNSFLSNCQVVHKNIYETNISCLKDFQHLSFCKEVCKFKRPSLPLILTDFNLALLNKTIKSYIFKHFPSFQLKGPNPLKFVCFDCKDPFIGVFTHFNEHMSDVHKINGTSKPESISMPVKRVAILCYSCYNLLVVLSPTNFNNLFSYESVNLCCHHEAIATVKKLVLNPNDTIISDSEIETKLEISSVEPPSQQHVDQFSPVANKKLKLIFGYLLSRYAVEPFCHECGTYYYCTVCNYGTSYSIYWTNHLAKVTHVANLKSLSNFTFQSHHCSLCGLTIYIEKDQIKLLNTYEHRNADDILKQKYPGKSDFLLNCIDALPDAEGSARFLSTICHLSLCKPGCKLFRLHKATEFCSKQPFVFINFNLIDLKKKLKNYCKANTSISKGKISFICLDCKPIYLNKLFCLDDHLFDKHGVNSHKCVDSSNCPRIGFFCCICSTLMVSFCSKFVENVAGVKGTNLCDHGAFIDTLSTALKSLPLTRRSVYFLSKLEKHLINSGFKCSYMKDAVSYACCLCRLNFTTLEDLCSHVLQIVHRCLHQHMIIFFCYSCNKVNLLIDSASSDVSCICVGCLKLSIGVFRLYKDLQQKLKDCSSVKDSTNKMRILSNVTINHSFNGGKNEYISCPVISSYYEFYTLNVSMPKDNGSQVISIHSSYIYRNVDISLLAHIQENECKGRSFQYHCLICDEFLKCKNSLCFHLKEKRHSCYCYFAAQNVQLIPFMIFCENCCLAVISADLISLERHFQSSSHIIKLRKPKITFPTLEDDGLWNISDISEQCSIMFRSKSSLNDAFRNLTQEMQDASKFYDSIKDKLSHDLLSVLQPTYPNAHVYFFGSRETGLAKKDSDIDIFVDLCGYYLDECKNIKCATFDLSMIFRNCKPFELKRTILQTMVPVIKLWHDDFQLDIDLNCFHSVGVENTKIMRFYLDFDERCRWLVVVIKEWAKLNFVLGTRNGLNSYCVAWMVLFFLMQPTVCVLPTVLFLKSCYKGPTIVINGWDHSYSLDKLFVKANFKTPSTLPNWTNFQLLKSFFNFYSKLNTNGVFLCTLTGKTVSTSLLENGAAHIYHNSQGIPVSMSDLGEQSPLIIMDAIRLNLNLTKNIHESLLIHFKILCVKILNICSWLD